MNSLFQMTWFKRMFVNENRQKSDTHFPWFILCVSIIDIALLIYSIVDSKGISPMSENWMAGPSRVTLIRNGAKFVPCMKPTQKDVLNDRLNCSSISSLGYDICTYEMFLQYICNVEKLKGFPYQVYRFLTPVFLHGGIIHLLLNLFNQLALGIMLERQYGLIRIGIIYILSGIGSILLSAIGFSQYASVGASGSIMGMWAVCVLDMIRNWEGLKQSGIPIAIDTICIIVLFIVGFFVPVFDSMGHLGGLLIGILSGLLFCPNLYWKVDTDNAVKSRLFIMGISSIFLLAFFLGGFIGFFKTTASPIFTVN
ncbi:unnamed protein product [Rotaria sp. Silwood1]|nr:unnamed protein product [Rotaria sp. Silwood1]